MGPAARHRGADAPARGSRRGPGADPRALPRRTGVRARHARARPRMGGLGRGPPRRTAPWPPRDRRADPPRRGPAVGPVAGPGRRAARAARHRHGDQQRLGRVPGRGERPPVPADGGRRAGHRPHAARPRAAARRPGQDRPPRQRHGVDPGVRRRRPPASRDRLGRRRQPVRPPGAIDARPVPRGRRAGLSDGPGRIGRGGPPCRRPRRERVRAEAGRERRRPPRRQHAADRGRAQCRVPVRDPDPGRVARLGRPGAAAPAPAPAPAPRVRGAARWATAWAAPIGYDPVHDGPQPPGGRERAALAQPIGEVRPPRLRRGRRRGVPGDARRPAGPPGRPTAGGDRGAPARRRQAGFVRGARPPPARRGLGGLAGGARPGGARTGGPGPPGDAPRRAGLRGLADDGAARGPDRGLRGQAGGAVPGADGRPLRAVAAQVPARVGQDRPARRRLGMDGGHVRSRGARVPASWSASCAPRPGSAPTRSSASDGRAVPCGRPRA